MRRRSQFEYLEKGELYSKDFSTNTISSIPKPFRFKLIKINKDAGQLLQGFTHTDGSSVIETVSDYEFKRGDDIRFNNETYKITNIEIVEIRTYGSIRGFKRYKKVISLT